MLMNQGFSEKGTCVADKVLLKVTINDVVTSKLYICFCLNSILLNNDHTTHKRIHYVTFPKAMAETKASFVYICKEEVDQPSLPNLLCAC